MPSYAASTRRSAMGAMLLLSAGAFAGCDGLLGLGRVCEADFRYGLVVTVLDSVTRQSPPSATLIARSGTYVDSVGRETPAGADVLRLASAGERAGTYDLTVRSPGYREWRRTGVRVTADDCHVRRVEVQALLQRG